jgi:hypothetical protein
MEIKNPIQIIYAPGTFGKCVRWMFDRFTTGSKFKDMYSPWDDDNRVHGLIEDDFSTKFKRGHQLAGRFDSPDPDSYKLVLCFEPKDLIFVERCGFYRNPGNENEKSRYANIIGQAETSFVKETFGDVTDNKSVAKELVKIQFHDMTNHAWWNSMNEFMTDEDHHHFDLCSLWDQTLLNTELMKASDRYELELEIDQKVIHNVVEKIKETYPVRTKDRAHQVLDAIESNHNIDCEELDILEQAYIEAELEKKHDCVIFPYGTSWFTDTAQINEFIDTYPAYLKHMNPRLPWYNNIKNPFYLTGRVDKSK